MTLKVGLFFKKLMFVVTLITDRLNIIFLGLFLYIRLFLRSIEKFLKNGLKCEIRNSFTYGMTEYNK